MRCRFYIPQVVERGTRARALRAEEARGASRSSALGLARRPRALRARARTVLVLPVIALITTMVMTIIIVIIAK